MHIFELTVLCSIYYKDNEITRGSGVNKIFRKNKNTFNVNDGLVKQVASHEVTGSNLLDLLLMAKGMQA